MQWASLLLPALLPALLGRVLGLTRRSLARPSVRWDGVMDGRTDGARQVHATGRSRLQSGRAGRRRSEPNSSMYGRRRRAFVRRRSGVS